MPVYPGQGRSFLANNLASWWGNIFFKCSTKLAICNVTGPGYTRLKIEPVKLVISSETKWKWLGLRQGRVRRRARESSWVCYIDVWPRAGPYRCWLTVALSFSRSWMAVVRWRFPPTTSPLRCWPPRLPQPCLASRCPLTPNPAAPRQTQPPLHPPPPVSGSLWRPLVPCPVQLPRNVAEWHLVDTVCEENAIEL